MRVTAPARGASIPSSALPLTYFAFAHLCLAAALATLVVSPSLPGAFFYHPGMIAVVHLLTLGWLTGSILGAFYIVAPLALVTPLPVRARDWVGFGAFVGGTCGMVAHFRLGSYDGMAWSAVLVLAPIAYLGARAWRGLARAPVAPAVTLHIRLAFINILAAGVLGIVIGLDRTRGFLGLSPLAATFTHAHIAALGFVAMMVIGLSYRLMPMMLPAAMPSGARLAASAVLIEAGLALLVAALFTGWDVVPAAALLMLAGLASFVVRMMKVASRRLPRPPALPRRDWSVWQVHAAFIWLVIAATLGFILSRRGAAGHAGLAWFYGTAGLVGFLAQIVTGMHGRLVPFYAWYRAMAAAGGAHPRGSAHALVSSRLAGAVFFAWTAGVPVLAAGLALTAPLLVRAGSFALLLGVVLGGVHLVHIFKGAHRLTRTAAPDQARPVSTATTSAAV